MPKLWMALCLALCWAEPVMAGPGGKIARAMFATPWGKVVLVVLTLIFLPLIIYTLAREWLAARRARRDLRFMARYSPQFDWLVLQERVKECFFQVHAAWSVDTIDQASAWMTAWYCQNQRRQLERWERDGLSNVCEVKRLSAIRPLFFEHRSHGSPHEGSLLAVSLTAKMKDYLVERASGKLAEGSKACREVETIWIFVLRDGRWCVNGIEEGSMSLTYAHLVRHLPPIESTLGDLPRRLP